MRLQHESNVIVEVVLVPLIFDRRLGGAMAQVRLHQVWRERCHGLVGAGEDAGRWSVERELMGLEVETSGVYVSDGRGNRLAASERWWEKSKTPWMSRDLLGSQKGSEW